MPENITYAELFCQSNFTFLHGASHPQELVKRADKLGYKALAITDECSVAGVVRAYTAIKEHNLSTQLIIGSLFKLGTQLQIVLLCPNRNAYAELCRIITNSRRRAPKGQYQLNEWDLRSIKRCLIIWLPSGTKKDDYHWATWFNKHHSTRIWLGYQRHLVANENRYLDYCEKLAIRYHLPITACGGVLMHDANRLPLQHVLTAINSGTSVTKLGRQLIANKERCLRPLDKLAKLFKPEWIEESAHIAQLCTFHMSELSYQYPAELIPKNKTPDQHLRELVLAGLRTRFPEGATYKVRRLIIKELKLIKELQYEYFFLTIHDIVKFAEQQQILYQGRGSAANSVVCYCLAITSVDPSQVEVLFERFISKERNEPPDIDVDFEHERREEVIQYVYQKYGRERTAIAATVITYRRKSAIREVGKALGINETQLDFFIKNINRRDNAISWQDQITELGFDPKSIQGQQFVSLVNEIKGFPRHLSQHVGGFVISAGPLYQLVPIENASMQGRSVIQWDKDDLESLRLIKVDVLALGMLTAIRKSFDLIKQHYQRDLSIAHITKLGDDSDVYQKIQQADTVGVFQIESRAQMSMLPRLKPKTYYDLVIQIAIVRPGPIQGGMVHPFLNNRKRPDLIRYPSEGLKDVLARTNGVPIFQEQVIKIAMVAGGFSGGEADQLRRAMGTWKKTGELEKHGEKLIKGMLVNGYSEEYAKRIFEQIKGFGEYGFPESHSASFAVLAYVSSWLKHYYPEAFYVGLLNSWPMGFYPPSQLIQDARRHAVHILPVCINHSEYDHTFEHYQDRWAIRLGIRQVKGISKEASLEILQKRPTLGFKSIAQLKKVGINQYQLESLASANALFELSKNRYAARWLLMDTESDLPLFTGEQSTPSYNTQTPTVIESMMEDYSSTSLSLSKHPIQLLREANLLGRHTPASQLIKKQHKQTVSVVGLVICRQRPGSSKGVTFFTLEDDTGNVNVIVWLATARAQKKPYLKSKILKVSGLLERGDGDVIHVIAGKLQDLSHLLDKLNTRTRNFH